MTTIRARWLPVLLVALLASVVSSVPSATADVTRADFPKTKRVANTFPYLDGGSRTLDKVTGFELYLPDCVSYRSGTTADSARLASYLTEDGVPPFFAGEEDPTFGLYEYADAAEARRAMRRYERNIEGCLGTHRADGVRRTISTFPVPRLGARQLGVRTITDNGGIDSAVEVYVRHGNRIERSWIQLDAGRASRAHVIQMARVLADVAR